MVDLNKYKTNKLREKKITVFYMDLDKFKEVNDTYGHDAGDEVLIAFSSTLKNNIRNFDLGVRLGGEEFLIVMPETDLAYAAAICERIRASIESKLFMIHNNQKSIRVTCSIGVSSLLHNEKEQEMIKRADSALYRAKQTGRNRVVIHKGANKNNPQQNVA